MVTTLSEHLHGLGIGMNSGDVVHEQQSTRNDTLLESVISVPLCSILRRILSSALKRIDAKLQDISDRFKNAGYVGSDDDSQVVSEFMGCVRGAVINLQVSGEARTELVI